MRIREIVLSQNRSTALFFIGVITLFIWTGCGSGSANNNSNNNSDTSTDLMRGAIPPPSNPPETAQLQYATTEETTVNIEAIKGRVIVLFNHDISEVIVENVITNNGGKIICKVPNIRYYGIEVSSDSVMDFITKMRKQPSVIFAEPDIPLQTQQFEPNEWPKLQFDQQQAYKDINILPAWGLIKGQTLSDVAISILEFDGFKDFDPEQKDFHRDRFLNKIPSYGTDNHGTVVAALAAAEGDNNYGNVGINWWSKISLYSSSPAKLDLLYYFLKAINDSQQIPTVINLSIGFGGNNDGVCQWLDNVLYNSMIGESLYSVVNIVRTLFPNIKFLVVKAAGNDGCELNRILTKPDNLIVVGGSYNETWFENSNYGSTIDIAAPFFIGWYDYKEDKYVQDAGTSFSTPFVSGAAALVWAKEPNLTPQEVVQKLKNASNKGTDGKGIAEFGGAGILDVYKALGGITSDTIPPSTPTNLQATAVSSTQINLSWSASPESDVEGYKIYRDGSYLKSVTTTSYSDTNLTPSTQYCYTISAYDAGGNESNQSNSVCEITSENIIYKIWAKTYGTIDNDELSTFQQTKDGGYILVGKIGPWNSYNDIWIIKLNSNGNIEWEKTYGGIYDDWATSIQQTSDGGYIVAGGTESFNIWSWADVRSVTHVWIFKLDSNGNISWEKVYKWGTGSDDWAETVQQTSDGGYIVGINHKEYSQIFPYNIADEDYWILKLDSNGNILWTRSYEDVIYSDDTELYSMQQTNDGGYVLAGRNGSSYWSTLWILKLDSNGKVSWIKTYSHFGNEIQAKSIQETDDGGYIIAGDIHPIDSSFGIGIGLTDIWLLKIDKDGNIDKNIGWEIIYGGADDDWVSAIQKTVDGGLIVAGGTCSFVAEECDMWVFKLDDNEDIIWEKAYGKSDFGNNEVAVSILQSNDGGYIAAGITDSFGAGNNDIWILKLDSNGTIDFNSSSGARLTDTNTIIIYPTFPIAKDRLITSYFPIVDINDSIAFIKNTNAIINQQAP